MVGAELDVLRTRAQAMVDALGWPHSRIRETTATIGGGSLPGDTLPSVGVCVTAEKPNRAARKLRTAEPPIVGRVVDDELVVDLRTVGPAEDDELVAALRSLFA